MLPIILEREGVVIAENHREIPRSMTKCPIRTNRAPQLHHHQAHGPQPDPKGSRQGLPPRRKGAAWDDDFLASLIVAQFFHPIPLCNRDQRVVDANSCQNYRPGVAAQRRIWPFDVLTKISW